MTTLLGYADLADLSEDDRIRVIGKMAEDNPGQIIGVVVDADRFGAKADRYVMKLLERYRVEIIDRAPGPVSQTTTIRIRRKADA